MNRVLSRLLTLVLLPVLLLATPRAAEASYQVGQVASATITSGDGSMGSGLSCGVSGYFVNSDAGASVKMSGSCSTDWQVSHAELALTVDGGSCEFAISYPELDGAGSLAGAMGQSVAGPINPASCIGTELCYSAVVNFHGDMADTLGGDYVDTGCVPFALGQMPEAEGATEVDCGTVKVTRPVAKGPPYEVDEGHWSLTYWHQKWDVTITGVGGTVVGAYLIGEATGVGTPYMSSWFDHPATVTADGVRHMSHPQQATLPSGVGPQSVTLTMDVKLSDKEVAPSIRVVGGGGAIVETDWGNLPQTTAAGRYGLTDAALCAAYWGPKIAVRPSAPVTTEPMGPLPTGGGASQPDDPDPVVTPPEPAAPGCDGFSVWDPSSWAGAGICAVVQAVLWLGKRLGALLTVIANLLGTLVVGIGNVLETLFVPSASSWGFDGLYDQFEARPPGSVLVAIGDGMSGFIGGYSGGGCGVLADFTSVDVDAQLTCSNVKSVPGYGALYALVQVGMLALTGLAVFRMLAGKVGGDDG